MPVNPKDATFLSILFMVLLKIVISNANSCQDILYNDCHYPWPVEEDHQEEIKGCHSMCELFDTIGECSFYYYADTNAQRENCKIYADMILEDFKRGCNLIGLPIVDSDGDCLTGDQDECNIIEDVCEDCKACQSEPCGGYIETECSVIGDNHVLASFPVYDLADCVASCSNVTSATFVTFTQEQQICECFPNSNRRCQNKIVTRDTDITNCHKP